MYGCIRLTVVRLSLAWCCLGAPTQAVAQSLADSAPALEPVYEDAAAAVTNQEYQALLARLRAAETRIDQLEGGASGAAGPAAPSDSPESAETDGAGIEQRVDALEQAAADAKQKLPMVKLTGFFHLDAGNFDQDATNMASLGDIENGVGFRRARLAAVGNVSDFTAYSIEMDFGTAGRPSFQDVWGEQQQIPFFGNVRIGQFRQPLTMDAWTPIRQLWFLERSLPFQAFDPFRRVGIMAYDKSEDEMWSWAYSVDRTGGFLDAPLGDSRFGTDIGDNGGASFNGRLTHLLYYDEGSEGRHLMHVGGFFDFARITGSNAVAPYYQARAIPEFFVGDPAGGGFTAVGAPFFVDTGRLPADQFYFAGLQLGGQYGSSHFQAEYMGTQVDQIGNPTVFYDGAYAQYGYFLTGEHRSYNRLYGAFDRVTPYTDFFSLGRHRGFCGWGAWETTARWSYVDLRDPAAAPIGSIAGPPQSPNPGRQDDVTLGLNWYWNAYAKLQFNWIHAFLDNAAGDSDCDIYCGRFQVEF